MEHSKIDQLFKEHGESFQMTPSADAWSKISDQLETKEETKKSYWKHAIAAAVCLVLVASIVILNQQPTVQPSEVAIKLIPLSPELTKKELALENLPKPEVAVNIKIEKPTIEYKELSTSYEALDLALQRAEPTTISTTRPDFNIDLSYPIGNEPVSVSIKYFASATPSEDSASKNKLGKFWEYAKSSSPAEIMADIRDAKDNLLRTSLD